MDTIILPITELLIISLFTETIIETVKTTSPKKLSESGIKAVALFLSIGLALLMHVSIFTGVPQNVILCGSVICGVIASRGSNFIHAFMDAMGDISKQSIEKK